MKNFLIDGIWQGPSEGIAVKEWLNEIVAYSGLDENLQPTGVIRRFQKIERARRNGRGRGKTLEAIAAAIDKLKNSEQATSCFVCIEDWASISARARIARRRFRVNANHRSRSSTPHPSKKRFWSW